jgi:hypothetical protein
MRPIRVLTWHIHGNYLLYLSRARAEFYLPVGLPGREGYSGRGRVFPFGDNVRDVPAERVRELELDCVLYQTRANYDEDRHLLLSERQMRLPQVYLQHEPPQNDPTDERHWFDERGGLLVHVTAYNALMWDSGRTPTRVIEHGVWLPEGVSYTGEVPRGLVAINHLRRRGRRLGADLFLSACRQVPLDLVGMDAESLGGLGEVPPPELPGFMARYRLYFSPIRYASLSLATAEAMTVGLPVVGLATTEMAMVIENEISGFIDTDPDRLIDPMLALLADRTLARRIGEGARRRARDRFGIARFARDWEETFAQVTGRPAQRVALAAGHALTED